MAAAVALLETPVAVDVSREAGMLMEMVGRIKEEFDGGTAPPVLAMKLVRGAVPVMGVYVVALDEKIDAMLVETVVIEAEATVEDDTLATVVVAGA